jgi:hypothetical protein
MKVNYQDGQWTYFLSLTHSLTHSHTHARARAHTHTHTQKLTLQPFWRTSLPIFMKIWQTVGSLILGHSQTNYIVSTQGVIFFFLVRST